MDSISPDKPVAAEPTASLPCPHVLSPGGEADGRKDPAARMAPAQEVDVWLGSYAGRTMWPSFLVCGLLTVGVFGGAWFFWAAQDADPLLTRYKAYGLIAPVWAVQLGRWAYRVLTFNYRLTNRRLLWERTFFSSAWVEVELARIVLVRVEANALKRLAGVGDIRLVHEDMGRPDSILVGVYRPYPVAARIRKLRKRAVVRA